MAEPSRESENSLPSAAAKSFLISTPVCWRRSPSDFSVDAAAEPFCRPISPSTMAAGLFTTNRSEEHTSELQSLRHLVCRLLPGKKRDCPPSRQPLRSLDFRADRTTDSMPAGTSVHLFPARTKAGREVRCVLGLNIFFFFSRAAPGVSPFSPPRLFRN